jgi:hypothetical protein
MDSVFGKIPSDNGTNDFAKSGKLYRYERIGLSGVEGREWRQSLLEKKVNPQTTKKETKRLMLTVRAISKRII